MSIWSLTCQQRVFQRCHSDKNSSEFFYLQDGGKNQQARIWHDYYVTATLCIIAFMSRTPPMNNGYLEAVRQKDAPIETAIANTNPAAALTASRRRHDFRFVISFFHLYLLAIWNEWLACWTHAQKGPGSNRSRDANCSHPLCLCPPSSKIGSSPLKGCGGNCRPGGK